MGVGLQRPWFLSFFSLLCFLFVVVFPRPHEVVELTLPPTNMKFGVMMVTLPPTNIKHLWGYLEEHDSYWRDPRSGAMSMGERVHFTNLPHDFARILLGIN